MTKNNPIKCRLQLKGIYYCVGCDHQDLCLKISELKKKASRFGTEGSHEAFVELVKIYDNLKKEFGDFEWVNQEEK